MSAHLIIPDSLGVDGRCRSYFAASSGAEKGIQHQAVEIHLTFLWCRHRALGGNSCFQHCKDGCNCAEPGERNKNVKHVFDLFGPSHTKRWSGGGDVMGEDIDKNYSNMGGMTGIQIAVTSWLRNPEQTYYFLRCTFSDCLNPAIGCCQYKPINSCLCCHGK